MVKGEEKETARYIQDMLKGQVGEIQGAYVSIEERKVKEYANR